MGLSIIFTCGTLNDPGIIIFGRNHHIRGCNSYESSQLRTSPGRRLQSEDYRPGLPTVSQVLKDKQVFRDPSIQHLLQVLYSIPMQLFLTFLNSYVVKPCVVASHSRDLELLVLCLNASQLKAGTGTDKYTARCYKEQRLVDQQFNGRRVYHHICW